MRSAAIYGCAGTRLTPEERAFFADARPWGFILFRRNVESPAQVAALTAELRAAVNDPVAPVLVDQEGGRVQRLGPPHWPKHPPAARYLEATKDVADAAGWVRTGARLMAAELRAVGITVDCAPVLDVPVDGAHDIIGDRAWGRDPATVATLGRAAADGLMDGGVLPVIKHLPGHGRAFADSHHALPSVEASLEELEAWDFAPFRALNDLPMAMTAHVVFRALDPDRPVTVSKTALGALRDLLGYDGLIMTDDLSMKALSGTLTQRAETALAAGCDVVLHCNGDLAEMAAVAKGARMLDGAANRRADAALARLPEAPEPFDMAGARAGLDALLAGRLEAARGPDVGEAQA